MTSLSGGERVPKTHIRVEAYGTVDELNSQIGLLVTYLSEPSDRELLLQVQNDLFVIGAYLATDHERHPERHSEVVDHAAVEALEHAIDRCEDGLPSWRGFILPGGSRGVAMCHVCRTVCRRAERRILELAGSVEVSAEVLAYVNRLSDYLFVLSRRMLFMEGKDEIIWRKR